MIPARLVRTVRAVASRIHLAYCSYCNTSGSHQSWCIMG